MTSSTMEIKLYWDTRLKQTASLKTFMQLMLNRLRFGFYRYEQQTEGPHPQNEYFTRLKKEVKAYARTKNKEHLINIANYARLEYDYPELRGAYHDATIESVTRRRAERAP